VFRILLRHQVPPCARIDQLRQAADGVRDDRYTQRERLESSHRQSLMIGSKHQGIEMRHDGQTIRLEAEKFAHRFEPERTRLHFQLCPEWSVTDDVETERVRRTQMTDLGGAQKQIQPLDLHEPPDETDAIRAHEHWSHTRRRGRSDDRRIYSVRDAGNPLGAELKAQRRGEIV